MVLATLHRVVLAAKLITIFEPRRETLEKCRDEIQVRFWLVPIYLNTFYEGITKDENTREELHVLSQASEQQIDSLNKLLTFWWFWSADRLEGRTAFVLSSAEVREGLRVIWDIDDSTQDVYTKLFDNCPPAFVTGYVLWNLMCKILKNSEMSLLSVMPHIRNAQVSTLQTLDQILQD